MVVTIVRTAIARKSTGKIVKKFFEVKVNDKLKNTSTISATTIKKGDAVTLNGSATGGMGDYTYAVLYKKKAETNGLQDRATKTTVKYLSAPTQIQIMTSALK